MKTNENLTLIQVYYDQEKTKPYYQYYVNQFEKKHGEYKDWYFNGQISCISNYKDGNQHGKYQDWFQSGKRWYIDTRHFKKGTHGTKIHIQL